MLQRRKSLECPVHFFVSSSRDLNLLNLVYLGRSEPQILSLKPHDTTKRSAAFSADEQGEKSAYSTLYSCLLSQILATQDLLVSAALRQFWLRRKLLYSISWGQNLFWLLSAYASPSYHLRVSSEGYIPKAVATLLWLSLLLVNGRG